jgi:clan AA aspartic protease
MGAVMQKVKLTNSYDAERVRRGELAADAIRSLEIDALVDTGATTLALPADVAERLDLTIVEETTVRLADGSVVPTKRVLVELDILGRNMVTTAFVMPTGTTPLIGQIPLEELDLVVEPRDHSLRVRHLDGRHAYILSAA